MPEDVLKGHVLGLQGGSRACWTLPRIASRKRLRKDSGLSDASGQLGFADEANVSRPGRAGHHESQISGGVFSDVFRDGIRDSVLRRGLASRVFQI